MVTPRAPWARRGSALLITVIILMVMFTLGSALLDLTTTSLYRSEHDMLRAQALDVAEAGVEKAIYNLRNTPANTQPTLSPPSVTETLSGAGSYTYSVTQGTGDDAGAYVIISTGTATLGSKSKKRTLRTVVTWSQENVSVWNNCIFGGVGQAGQSIQGNVVMRGSVHILGEGEPHDNDPNNNGRYDSSTNGGTYAAGDWYIDSAGNGSLTHAYTGVQLPYVPGDAFCEPFTDLNGNGVWDPPLTQTDLAQDVGGTANVGNNYSGMPSNMQALIPTCPTETVNGQAMQGLSAKVRVKHGQVSIDGTATVGSSTNGGSPAMKGTMDGTYVSDGWTGNSGATNVYSDNGTSHGYDLGDFVNFPDLMTPETVGGVNYANHMAYLSATGLVITGPLNLTVGTPYTITDGWGNSLSVDASGNMSISGIIYVNGDINLNRGGGNSSLGTFTYSGRGTLTATGNIYVHTNVLPQNTFPTSSALGMIAQQQLQLATGSGDSQLQMMGAFYAQQQVVSYKQNSICGTFVSSYYAMQNVPAIYEVPTLATNLPPGMPGSDPIWIVTTNVNSWREVAPS
jgi:hypothetical protein